VGTPPSATPLPRKEEKSLDIGDADAAIQVLLRLAPEAITPLVREETVVDARKNLNRVEVTSNDPGLATLPVIITVRTNTPFVERPVVVRGILERDGTPIASFTTVLGAYAMEQDPGTGIVRPREFKVDVLANLPEVPDSMLLNARADLLMLLPGTDESTIDPLTAIAEPGFATGKLSNPLRVTFAIAPTGTQVAPTPAPVADSADAAADSPAEEATTEETQSESVQ